MPYQKDGKRNYREEYDKYHSKPEQRKNRSERTVARNDAIKDGTVKRGDGKDLDHRKPLSKGGTSAKSNLRAVSASSNRSFSRNADGSMKSQTSKRERKK
jgi:hypothetical protein